MAKELDKNEAYRSQIEDTQPVSTSLKTFDAEKIGEVRQALRDYAAGKASIDAKATENHEWWRVRHWNVLSDDNEGKKDTMDTGGSAWAFNSIINKHADIMDNFPKPNVMPREADDIEEAKILTRILPVIEDQTDAEEVFSDAAFDFLIDGTSIKGIFWDNSKHDGLGDIVKNNIDVHNVFWQPGVRDIQDSKYFFNVSLANIDVVKAMYPKIADKIGPNDTGTVVKYIHDDTIDTTKDVEVIDVYYKTVVMKPVMMNVGEGSVMVHQVPQTQLHLATLIGDECVFCSEDDPKNFPDGFYSHGKYPFVFCRLFPIKDSPCGFGYLDVMKQPQKMIDKVDWAIAKNAMRKAKPRWWVKKNADINKEDFADWDVEMVEVGTGDLGNAVMQMQVDTMPGFITGYMENKINELKETSGNRDFSQGQATAGVTAASAIAALQEAGSKLARDMNKTLYRAAREEYELEIELIRQFYTEERTFRIDDGAGGYSFETYSNGNLVPQDIAMPDGTIRHKKALFDVSISAEKNSPFSRAAQNETAKELYQLGFFAPGNEMAALTALDMMEFDDIDKIKKDIQENSQMMQQYQMMAQFIVMNAPEIAMQMGLVDPAQMGAASQGQAQLGRTVDLGEGSAEERAARKTTDRQEDTRVANARKAAREMTNI
ncbi:MAG: hypothetical protein MJZ12_01715 [Prevotella sp.]|nr:hypothetical protein [Prevotella sp.]